MKRIIPVLLLVFLCGCFKTKDELTINADGSGTVRIETRSSIPPEMQQMAGSWTEEGGKQMVMYPPTSEDDGKKFFPGKDFTVTIKQDSGDNGETVTIIEATFKDLNALLNSPYGRAHALTAKVENGVLTVKGVTGMEAAARFAEMKDDGEMGMSAFPGFADVQKKKDEMRAEFRVTLPNAINGGNGARDGKTASWVIDRAKVKDAAEFARQLGTVSEASCSADGVKLSPVTPIRLGLLPFKELAEGVSGNKGAALDTNKISAAAKFVPYQLVVTRSLDLSGEGSVRENGAQLTGAIVLPSELAPQKWGEPKLDEVVDAKGANLKLRDGEGGRGFTRSVFYGMNSDEDENEPKAAVTEARHVVTIGFKPPDWKVREIARIKGFVSLQYFGGSQTVLKLTNAVPATWIIDASKAMRGGAIDSTEKKINDSGLSSQGLTLGLRMAIAQNGMTMLQLQPGGTQAVLSDVQVFDADGTPFPTFFSLQSMMGDEGQCRVIVAGLPKPPLSLAVLVSGGGATVDVPILLEHVPVADR